MQNNNIKNSIKKETIQEQILELVDNGILVADNAGQIIFANSKFYKMWNITHLTHYTNVYLLAEAHKEQLKYPEEFLKLIKNSFKLNKNQEERDILELKNGKFFERFRNLLIENEKVIGLVVTFRDITEEKQAKINKDILLAAVADSTNELVKNLNFEQAIMKAFEILGKTISVDKVYLYENSCKKESSTYFSSKKFEWVTDPKYSQINNKKLQNFPFTGLPSFFSTLKQNKPIIGLTKNFETDLKQILEELEVISLFALPIFINDYFWGFVGFDDCKKERVWSEAEKSILLSFASSISSVIEINQRREKEKNRIKQELELAIAGSDIGLWHWNLKTDQIIYSNNWLETLGYDKNDKFTLDKLFHFINPEDFKTLNTYVHNCLNGETRDFEATLKMKTKNNESKWVFTKAKILEYDENKKPLIVAGTHLDITEKKKIHELIIQNEKMISIGCLAAGMAHEINNPLGSILLSCHNIKRRISPDFDKNLKFAEENDITLKNLNLYLEKRGVHKFINDIETMGQRASHIVNDMLCFSRKSSATPEDFDLSELLDKTVKMASTEYNLDKKFDFRQIEIIKEYKEIPTIKGKKIEIEQVLFNLIKNAAQSMSSTKLDPKIILRSYKNENFVRVEIEDNGAGMNETTQKHAFEPFFTTKEIGSGTGLGLSVSYFIITDSHSGKISFESELGEGTKFIIELPICYQNETKPVCNYL